MSHFGGCGSLPREIRGQCQNKYKSKWTSGYPALQRNVVQKKIKNEHENNYSIYIYNYELVRLHCWFKLVVLVNTFSERVSTCAFKWNLCEYNAKGWKMSSLMKDSFNNISNVPQKDSAALTAQVLDSLWCFCCHGRPPAESRGLCS